MCASPIPLCLCCVCVKGECWSSKGTVTWVALTKQKKKEKEKLKRATNNKS